MKSKNMVLVIIVLAILGLVGILWMSRLAPPSGEQEADPQPVEEERRIGGDRDEHGCLIGGGYTWCESKQKCLREWEEPCE